jgi:hypothetical protein
MKNYGIKIQRSLFAAFLIAALLIGFAGTQTVQAAGPWYVSPTGNDANDCLSEATACATINGAVAKADPGDTINVLAGTYVEDLTIDKALTLLGPNHAINPNSGVRVEEAILLPATSNPDPDVCEVMAYIGASDVTVKGFTFNGDNPDLTSGVLINGADVDACEILAGYDGIGNIVIENNILKYSTYSGVDFYNYTNDAATAGNFIRYNLLEDIGETTYNWGIGVLVYNNFYADITDNVFNRVRTGIQTGNYYRANPGTTGSISNNTLNVWRLGIFHNLWYSNASPIAITENAITALSYAGMTKWNGILLTSMQGTTTAMIQNNTITIPDEITFPEPGYTAGYNIWNITSTSPIAIHGGVINGGDYGVFVNNFEGYSDNAANTDIIIDGVTSQNAKVAGFYVKDSPLNTNGATVHADILNSQITGASTGILVEGSDATAIVHGNSIAATTAGLTNTTGTLVDASGNWWGTADAAGVAGMVSTSVDYTPWLNSGLDLDLAATGFQGDFAYLNVDDSSPQFGTIVYIQEAIDMASLGGTVNVWDGTYYGGIMIQKPLMVQSQNGAAATVIHGGLTTPAIYVVSVRANDVTLDGFTVTNPLYSLHNADVTGIMVGYYGDNNLSNIAVVNNIVTEIGSPERALDTTADYPSIGIVVNGVIDGLEIANNTIHNIHQTVNDPAVTWGPSAIGIYGFDTTPLSTNLSVHDNEIYNISATNAVGVNAISNGIRFGWGSGDGTIANNLIHDVDGRGIQLNTYNNGAVNINANEIYNATLVGVAVENAGGGAITANNIYQNGSGITISAGVTAPVVAHFNRIADNTTGINNLSATAVDAENNWWGCNAGPAGEDCLSTTGLVDADPWLVLTFTADQTKLIPGGVIHLTADLSRNSAGADTSAQGAVMDGLLINFDTTYGTLDPLSAGLVNASTATTLTVPAPVTVTSATVWALLDNQTVEIVFGGQYYLFLPIISR